MKSTNISIFMALLIFCTNSYAQQKTEIGLKKLQEFEAFYFYGYDFSKAKVTDAKRGGQDLANYMHQLVGEMLTGLEVEKMKKWFRLREIEFRLNTTYTANKFVKSEDLFYPNYMPDKSLTLDSINIMIRNYEISEDDGVGFVVIYEYFSRDRKSVSGYGCFFDVKSREILCLMGYEAKDGNSYRSFRDYWTPAKALIKKFADKFVETRKI